MIINHRDLALAALADDEADLRERLASLEEVASSYRILARAALHALHDMTVERDRARAQHHRLLDEYRRLRVQLVVAA